MSVEEIIRSSLEEVMKESCIYIKRDISLETVLLDTGLDSLGFAILVAKLEETLGYDPFISLEDAVYPKTFGDFVKIYENYK